MVTITIHFRGIMAVDKKQVARALNEFNAANLSERDSLQLGIFLEEVCHDLSGK